MKLKLTITILALSLVTAFTNAQTKPLTKVDFLKKVANYESSPSKWIYLGQRPCMIDFYTTWCGPCKRLAPILEDLSKEYAGRIDIYKVDTEKEPELAAAFGVRSIPTLLFCPMGENPQIAQGALPKETLVEVFENLLLKKKK